MTSLPPDSVSNGDSATASPSEALLEECIAILGPESQYDRSLLKTALSVLADSVTTVHPGLKWQSSSFLQYATARLPGYLPAEQEVARLHAGDLLLAQACSEGSTLALAKFDSEFLPLVTVAGRKLKMSDMQCDELRQQVRLKLLVRGEGGAGPKIGNYAGTGALRSWVYATALRTGLNELRRIGRSPVPAGDEQLLVAMPDRNDDQELQYMKELYRSAFKESFRASISALEDRLGNVLRHYYLDEMTLDQIGGLYRVHKTTVMRWVNKAHAELEVETKQRMVAHLKLQPSEVESVMRLIQSGIQLGLASVLAIDKSES